MALPILIAPHITPACILFARWPTGRYGLQNSYLLGDLDSSVFCFVFCFCFLFLSWHELQIIIAGGLDQCFLIAGGLEAVARCSMEQDILQVVAVVTASHGATDWKLIETIGLLPLRY